MQISVNVDLRGFVIGMRRAGLDHTLAAAKALTFTAEAVRQAERAEMRRVFDRPTPYTINSLFLKGATPQNLEARVWFKTLGAKSHYLSPQVDGGARLPKAFEMHLRSAGILPQGMFAVPGGRAQLDAYGNFKSSELVKLLSALRALPQQGYLANRSAASARRRAKQKRPRALVNYFVGAPKRGGPMGVWERVGQAGLRPILIFVRAPRYRKRFDFYGIAQRVAGEVFPVKYERELQRVYGSLRWAA